MLPQLGRSSCEGFSEKCPKWQRTSHAQLKGARNTTCSHRSHSGSMHGILLVPNQRWRGCFLCSIFNSALHCSFKWFKITPPRVIGCKCSAMACRGQAAKWRVWRLHSEFSQALHGTRRVALWTKNMQAKKGCFQLDVPPSPVGTPRPVRNVSGDLGALARGRRWQELLTLLPAMSSQSPDTSIAYNSTIASLGMTKYLEASSSTVL